MYQTTQRASLNLRWPTSPNRRVDSLPREPYGRVPPSPHTDHTYALSSSRLTRLAGLGRIGDAQLGQQIGTYGSVAGSLTTGALALAHASSLVPIVGPIIAGVSVILSVVIANSGCGQTCVISTDIVNKLEPELKKNVDGYLALPSPRPRAAQVLALANFDAAWNWLQSSTACGAPQLGDAGKRCISDRASGSCVWHDNGKCWNWFVGYRDPIANDPTVTDTAASDHALSVLGSNPTATAASLLSSNGSSGSFLDSKNLLLFGGLALLAFAAMSGGEGRN
jgi:hypothetical protein